MIPKAGVELKDPEGFFGLELKTPAYPKPVQVNGTFYVFRLKAIEEPSLKDFEAEKEEIRARLLSEKQDAAVDKWLEGLRVKAKIKVNEDLL
jgi:peptidyl-prolyl cis-trans isomerase D